MTWSVPSFSIQVSPDVYEAANFTRAKRKILKELAPGLEFNDIDELELARQLTLISFDHYSRIERVELLSQAWAKRQHMAPNLRPLQQ